VELQVVKAEMHDGNQWVEDVGATEEKNGRQEGSGAVMIMGHGGSVECCRAGGGGWKDETGGGGIGVVSSCG
jgi:hypothetical protein